MKGDTWNESETYADPVTGRTVRRLTRWGYYNQTPNYHTHTGFTADGEWLVFASGRVGRSMILKAEVATGDLTELVRVDAMGTRTSQHRGNGGGVGSGAGVTGDALCLAPRSRWCVYYVGRSLRAVHLDTFEERTLIGDCGKDKIFGHPSVSPDEQTVVVPIYSGHPEIVAGTRITRSYISFAAEDFPVLSLVEVPLAGGEMRTLYEEIGCHSAHTPHCPANGDLILMDRDLPPRLWGGSDGETPRLWLLDRRSGEVRPLKTDYPAPFQVHAAWTFDGGAVLYHGPLPGGGTYLGVATPEGETLREFVMSEAVHYGHLTADPQRPAWILDGNLFPDLLTWVRYDAETPQVEVIARHATEWRTMPWQFTHPHPLDDPTGRWISFNAAHQGRSDVFVVQV